MRDLRFAADKARPFASTSPIPGLVVADQTRTPARFRIGRHLFNWTRYLLAGVGVLTIGSFIAGVTPIPEQIGNVTGRIAAAATGAQTRSQVALQGAIAAAQQQATVDPQRQIQAWQFGLQADLATLTSALDGTKTLLITKATADYQGRNNLLQINAQLQADRFKQIMQLQEQLERGNITSAQVLDMVRNLKEAFGSDATRLRQQAQSVKTEVLDAVTRVTPIADDNGAGITDPLEAGGVLDVDVQVAMGDLERRITAIQEHFAVRAYAPPPPPVRP